MIWKDNFENKKNWIDLVSFYDSFINATDEKNGEISLSGRYSPSAILQMTQKLYINKLLIYLMEVTRLFVLNL